MNEANTSMIGNTDSVYLANMKTRTILRRILYRFVEGFLITLFIFTFFDLFWYGYDAVKALVDGSDLSMVKLKLTLNLSRLLSLPIVYSLVLVVLDSFNVQTKGPLLEWIEERYLG